MYFAEDNTVGMIDFFVKFAISDDPKKGWTDPAAFTILILILAFGLFVIYCAANIIKRGFPSEVVTRTFGVFLVVFFAALLPIVCWKIEQITPVLSLLGTIAGYLIGKEPSRDTKTTISVKGESQ